MGYVSPKDVIAPQDRWRLTRVLYDGGEGESAIAIGEWKSLDGVWEPALAQRWNGWDGKEKGNPISTGHPTWFIVPDWMSKQVLEAMAAKIADELKPIQGVI